MEDVSFHGLSPDEFKVMMTEVMNTSVSMLDKVYMEASNASYGDQIASILQLGDFENRLDDYQYHD